MQKITIIITHWLHIQYKDFLKTGSHFIPQIILNMLSSCLNLHTCLHYRPEPPSLANSTCHVSGEDLITDFLTNNTDFSPSSQFPLVEASTLKHHCVTLCISTIPKMLCHEY